MNFEVGAKSKKVKNYVSNNNVTIPNEQILNYLFDIKQKIDLLYHTCSMSHVVAKNDKTVEENDFKSCDQEPPKLIFKGFQSNSNNLTNSATI